MKRKIEYLILIIIIAAVAGFLILQDQKTETELKPQKICKEAIAFYQSSKASTIAVPKLTLNPLYEEICIFNRSRDSGQKNFSYELLGCNSTKLEKHLNEIENLSPKNVSYLIGIDSIKMTKWFYETHYIPDELFRHCTFDRARATYFFMPVAHWIMAESYQENMGVCENSENPGEFKKCYQELLEKRENELNDLGMDITINEEEVKACRRKFEDLKKDIVEKISSADYNVSKEDCPQMVDYLKGYLRKVKASDLSFNSKYAIFKAYEKFLCEKLGTMKCE